jgi:hypothetical protein
MTGNASNAWNRAQSAFRSFRNIVDIPLGELLRGAVAGVHGVKRYEG